jgi:exo-beta-1,3-glucanase (GH17 family)
MAVDGSDVLALLNAVKNFNDSLSLDLQHRRIQVAIGIYETLTTSPSDKTSFILNAIRFVETFDFIHSVYLGNEQIREYGFGFPQLRLTISEYRGGRRFKKLY